jgi:hypothetical protein
VCIQLFTLRIQNAENRVPTHQGPDDRPGPVGEYAPVGAKLVAHHDAGYHAHAEHHSEDAHPVFEGDQVDRFACDQPKTFEHRQVGGQADGEGRKNNVEGDREGELKTGQLESGEPLHEHDSLCRLAPEHHRYILNLWRPFALPR